MDKEKEVINVIEKIKPYIQRDGGDIEFVSLEDGVVTVRMLGACVGCLAIEDTLTLGVESMIMEEVEGIRAVVMEDPLPVW